MRHRARRPGAGRSGPPRGRRPCRRGDGHDVELGLLEVLRRSGVVVPGDRLPLGDLQVQAEASPASSEVSASSQSLTAGVPHGFTAGRPQTSTVTESRANGIQARATAAGGQRGGPRLATAVGLVAWSSSCANRHSSSGFQNAEQDHAGHQAGDGRDDVDQLEADEVRPDELDARRTSRR